MTDKEKLKEALCLLSDMVSQADEITTNPKTNKKLSNKAQYK